MKLFKSFFCALVFIFNLSIFSYAFGQNNNISFILKSDILNEDRLILISIPEDYYDTDELYPVHYVLDAELTFEYYSSMVNVLSVQGSVPRAIVVGIPNTNRNRDFYPDSTGGDKKFTQFLRNELIPHIDSSYKAAHFRVISGHSLAGLFVLNTFFYNSDLFSAYIAGSPYLDPVIEEYVNNNVWENVRSKTFLYISRGSSDIQSIMKYQKVFVKSFKKSKRDDIYFLSEIHEGKNHNTNSLINFLDGNLFVFSRFVNYNLPSDPSQFDIDDLYKYAQDISAEYGFKVNIPESFLVFIGNEMIKFGRYDDARRAAEIIDEQFSNSIEDERLLYNLYKAQGKTTEAEELKLKYNFN